MKTEKNMKVVNQNLSFVESSFQMFSWFFLTPGMTNCSIGLLHTHTADGFVHALRFETYRFAFRRLDFFRVWYFVVIWKFAPLVKKCLCCPALSSISAWKTSRLSMIIAEWPPCRDSFRTITSFQSTRFFNLWTCFKIVDWNQSGT